MEKNKIIPTRHCIIIGEIDYDTYRVEIICPGGGTHTHGLCKNEIEVKSHRVGHCQNCNDEYYLYLPKAEVVAWDEYKKNNK